MNLRLTTWSVRTPNLKEEGFLNKLDTSLDNQESSVIKGTKGGEGERVRQAGDHWAAHASESSCITITCVSKFVSPRPLTRPTEHARANPSELARRSNINLRQG